MSNDFLIGEVAKRGESGREFPVKAAAGVQKIGLGSHARSLET